LNSTQTNRIIPIKQVPITVADEVLVSLYEAQKKIYPRSVAGFFTRWRWVMVFLTQAVFYGLPWLQWGDRQAMLFDLGTRRFYIFNLVLYPQDFIYLTGLLVISALSLFLFTAVAGRLWCGFTCPQTVYTEIFLWIEKKVEGDRVYRMKLDAQSFSAEKLVKKWFKHMLWLMLSLFTGFTFVGYFTPIHNLAIEFFTTNMGSWEVFWVFFYGFTTYGNAGFMREQVCKYMCPYARFQSAMFDKDTLIVTYDQTRGEPRGTRSKKDTPSELNLGDCIDCKLCVQVCPTGIDIRNGLQYECIGCGACVDVCNSVMDKIGYSRGLVKFSTENALKQQWDRHQILSHILRPRIVVYTSILLAISFGLVTSLALRKPFKVDVVRDRGALARIAEGGNIENVYRLQFMNASEQTQQYRLSVKGIPNIMVSSEQVIAVKATESRWVPLRLQIPPEAASNGSHPIEIDIEQMSSGQHLSERAAFLIPR
jgi:cytochrome c oxidase accessory protein FixG